MVKLTDTAMTVLRERYFIEGESEWEDLVERVCTCFADSDEEYAIFYDDLCEMNWLGNSPILMNAGTEIKAYSACYVLPVEDNIESIYKFYSDAALISKSGGGVGANYSAIRGKDAVVNSTGGVASGPLSFIRVQDVSTDIIKQGGRRRGANMGILNVEHPDIWSFISAKDTAGEYENFNFSVGITDSFMELKDAFYKVNAEGMTEDEYAYNDSIDAASDLWDEIIRRAHSSAEPGVLFMDTIGRDNPTPHLGEIVGTNPCSEQPLLPYESCTLGSINLSNMVMGGEIDWDKLRASVHNLTLFLNRVLDNSTMPIEECQHAMEATRKIGVGIMGLASMMIKLGIAYGSSEGVQLAYDVQKFVSDECDVKSTELGGNEGLYGAWVEGCPKRRNACLTTSAPTGTLSTLANCSSGIEPHYAPIYTRDNMGQVFHMACAELVDMARELQIKEEGIESIK